MLANSYRMKLVCVQNKKKKRRRKQAISSHTPYCFASFLGGPLKFTPDGLKKYPDVSTHSARWVKSLAVLQSHI